MNRYFVNKHRLIGDPLYYMWEEKTRSIFYVVSSGKKCLADALSLSDLISYISDLIETTKDRIDLGIFNATIPNEKVDKLIDALSCGGIGMDTIILLHNAANVLEELGNKTGAGSAKQYAADLRYKAKMEYDALMNLKENNNE